MFRATVCQSGKAARDYYTSALSLGDYYVPEDMHRSEWCGEGAKLLGLAGPVTRESFCALADNRHPGSDEQLTPRHRANRRVGYDCNFHAPKSVSIAALPGNDPELLDAVWDATTAVMRTVEERAHTRVRTGGRSEDRKTENLVWAQFLHPTSRPVDGVPDPHVHVHCFVFNCTFDREEGRWKAAQLGPMLKDAPFIQAVFHSELVKRVESLGYGVRLTEDAWEIAGIDRGLIEKYSRRTEQIERTAAKKGIDDPEKKAGLGAKTRQGKATSVPWPDVERHWHDRMAPEEQTSLGALKGKQNAAPVRGLEEAMRLAVGRTFERSAVVRETALVAEVLRACPGQATPEAIRAAFERHGVITRDLRGVAMVTTKSAVAAEQELVSIAKRGRGALPALLPPEKRLSPENESNMDAAARRIGRSQNRVTLVRTNAVSDQKQLAEAVERSLGWMSKSILYTTATGLGTAKAGDDDSRGKTESVYRLLGNDPKLKAPGRGVVWVADAHRMPLKAASELLGLAESKGFRLVLSGDALSRGGVFRGNPMDVLQRHAGLAPIRLGPETTERGAKERAASALAAGRAAEAEKLLSDSGALARVPSQSLAREAGKLLAARLTAKSTGLAVTPTPILKREVTEATRVALKLQGKLKGERSFERLVRAGLTQTEKSWCRSYRKGMVVEFSQHSGSFRRGDRWTVTGTNMLGFVEVRSGVKLATLPLRRPDRFEVFEKQKIDVGIRERVRITKNIQTRAVVDTLLGVVSKAHVRPNRTLTTGSIHRVREFTALGHMVLDNGFILKKNAGHFDHGYTVTSQADLPRRVDHVVCVDSKDSGNGATAEKLAKGLSLGRRSAAVVTDRESLTSLPREAPSGVSSLDVGTNAKSLVNSITDVIQKRSHEVFGVKPISRELERSMER